jgi:hypothetical protein
MDTLLQFVLAVIQYIAASSFILLVCLTPPVAIGVVYYTLFVRSQDRHIVALAEQMGLQLTGRRRGSRFGGAHLGHVFSIGRVISGYYGAGGRHYSPALSVHLELASREPLRGRVGRSGEPPGADATFETAFRQEAPIQRLSPGAREAMLAFVHQHGNLWLEAFRPETNPCLEHTLASISGATPESVRAALDDLVEVARVIESTSGLPQA